MALDIGDALRSGIDDLTSETGLLVGAVVLLYSLGALVINQSLGAALLNLMFERGVYGTAEREAIQTFSGGSPFSLGIDLAVAGALAVVVTLLGELVRFWAIRQFAGPEETKTVDPTSRAAMAVVLGGAVAVLLLFFQQVLPIVGQLGGTAMGLVGSIVGPIGGIVLLTIFVYLRQEIALDDGGYGATVRRSLTRFMDEPSVLILLLVLGIVGIFGSAPTFAIGFLGRSTSVGGISVTVISQLLSVLLNTIFVTLGIAVITDAYLQVRASANESTA